MKMISLELADPNNGFADVAINIDMIVSVTPTYHSRSNIITPDQNYLVKGNFKDIVRLINDVAAGLDQCE